MKLGFSVQPATFFETWPGEFETFSWHDFLTAIPSPIFLATTYKDNGKENACLQSWSTFVGVGGDFLCVMSAVSIKGHFYKSLMERQVCVLNFPSADIYGLCEKTIINNQYEDDEIAKSGLTAVKAETVDAPLVVECFLNIECELMWEKAHYEGSDMVVLALKAKHILMDRDYFDEDKKGRYGDSGYIYNIHAPRNPDTGLVYETSLGTLKK